MSRRYGALHSHSGLERELNFPKHIVLVDEEYKELFMQNTIEPFRYNGKTYYKVPTLSFAEKGGAFKSFME
jgi:hypothetical protein